MNQNMGLVDRGIRIAVVILVVVLYFTHQITGVAFIILAILAAILLLTSLVGVCPLYLPFGISTKSKEK